MDNSYTPNKENKFSEIGFQIFRLRDYTPILLILAAIYFEKPSVFSATVGLLLIAFGELFRIYSVAFIGPISRTRKGSLGKELVKKGPFALVRNPLYVANFFIAFGFAVFSGVLWIILITIALFTIQYYFIVNFEENLLEEHFGEEYLIYKNTVPRWIPNNMPNLDEISWPESYTTALRSERRTLSSIALVIALLILFS